MSTSTLALAAILALSPADAPRQALPGWAETPGERLGRSASIAEDVAAVADEACAGQGPACQRWALGLLVGIAWHESGFAPDVDAGRCYRGVDGRGPRCDGGRAHSLWQIQTGGEEAAQFDRDRRAAARAALRHATGSWRACARAGNPREELLAAYAGGRCSSAEARRVARSLWGAVSRALGEVDRARAAEAAGES